MRAGAFSLALGVHCAGRAAPGFPIADAHSHIGLITPAMVERPLKMQMEDAGVMLLSWNLVGDGRWIQRTNGGIKQTSTPAPGQQAAYFREGLARMRRYLATTGLDFVRSPADIDAAKAGKPQVVIAVEGAGFAADDMKLLDEAYAQGLRHVQLVHYIRNALGDFQTERPEHDGMTALGIDVVKSCNRLGILVDLAHATNPVIDKALEVSAAPVIWSHSAIARWQYGWQQSAALSRLLSLVYAKKIAERGGAIGLWSLSNTVGYGPSGYASELMRMVDLVGPRHVMFGTDLDGVGNSGALNGLADLRKVVDLLRERGVDDETLRAICFENYARCLKAAMDARTA